ncbi:cytosine permease ASCRUDRAFT_78317 [Ascoidea rubescens DSM 1968]|uniref:Purine-cytosine permease n=1 Tax=Ascoidea rubescens DSM 1968 TaxID=1344418 RepID=A0A1D2V8R1_9ASCO|nr:hypothetical protein ASCRUDRAFT_78317 [Ascoidea rubescens DSM 1968]ODV57885.1 hypothetical protein ASCRUDRAFT_78317 [Ascoidea rubescens DSM 1968]
MSEDIEKKPALESTNSSFDEDPISTTGEIKHAKQFTKFDKFAKVLKAEIRGVERVPENEKTDASLWSAASMWLAANMVISTFSLGALGVTVFALNFYQCLLIIIFFNFMGTSAVAFYCVFGAKFGLRQMILSNFLVGVAGTKIFAFINLVACIGWGSVNIMASAQLFHIVNNNALPPWAGCLILVICTVLVSFFGYNVIHTYEKFSWIPNLFVFIVIIARMSMSGNFTPGEWATGRTGAGNVLSFGGTIFGFAAGWTTFAADYTTYMPSNTNPYKIFFSVLAGLTTTLIFAMTLGAACATGTLSDPAWADLYNEFSIGGLVYAILVRKSLHGFGEFCCVLLGLSTVANNLPNMYSMALSAQAFSSYFRKIPRIFWTLFGNFVTLAICIPAYYEFAEVMHNFMNLIGYYLSIYIGMSVSEHVIYRKGFKGYNPEDYLDRSKLPIGIAGTIGFCFGLAGVILGMNQTWYQGVLAHEIGDYGGDIGFELGMSFSFVAFNIVRPLEIKYFGR